jgi:hypothetical protein
MSVLDQLTPKEAQQYHSYNIAEIVKAIALEHPDTLELVLALAGPEVAEKIDDIYRKFVQTEGQLAIELGMPALKTVNRVELAMDTEAGDNLADLSSLDDFKNLIVRNKVK